MASSTQLRKQGREIAAALNAAVPFPVALRPLDPGAWEAAIGGATFRTRWVKYGWLSEIRDTLETDPEVQLVVGPTISPGARADSRTRRRVDRVAHRCCTLRQRACRSHPRSAVRAGGAPPLYVDAGRLGDERSTAIGYARDSAGAGRRDGHVHRVRQHGTVLPDPAGPPGGSRVTRPLGGAAADPPARPAGCVQQRSAAEAPWRKASRRGAVA